MIALGQFQATLTAAIGPANWTKQPSFAPHDRLCLPCPVTDFRIASAEPSGRQLPHDLLVGDSCPSFPEPNSAWRAFFEGDCSLVGAQNPPTDLAVLRVVQDAGRLGHVRVTATQLTVEVNGTSLEGCELELFGVTGRASQRISSAGEVTFSLDRGLPEHAWLWLKIPTRPYRGPHFAAFPIDLPLRCIAAGCKPGGTVLDMFAGTATTGVAAIQLGRRFTGMELSAEFADLAADRLRQAQRPEGGKP